MERCVLGKDTFRQKNPQRNCLSSAVVLSQTIEAKRIRFRVDCGRQTIHVGVADRRKIYKIEWTRNSIKIKSRI